MSSPDFIVLGAQGLIGSAVFERLRASGATVLSVERDNYETTKGTSGGVLVNCDGNSSRFRANQDPAWDFRASVDSVALSIFYFRLNTYIYLSTVDVYNHVYRPATTMEETRIDSQALMPYAFHKWLSERLVERYASSSVILRLGTALGPRMTKNPIYDLLHGNPLFISPESEISFIDTATIAESVVQVLAESPSKEIFNVASTGASRIKAIADKLRLQPSLASEADKTRYCYRINNSKISRLMGMPTSDEVVSRFLDLTPEFHSL